MEQLFNLGIFFGGVGIMLIGIGVLWGVAVWSEKDK
jgi:hypothetical protein